MPDVPVNETMYPRAFRTCHFSEDKANSRRMDLEWTNTIGSLCDWVLISFGLRRGAANLGCSRLLRRPLCS